jgi:hypothetical protein
MHPHDSGRDTSLDGGLTPDPSDDDGLLDPAEDETSPDPSDDDGLLDPFEGETSPDPSDADGLLDPAEDETSPEPSDDDGLLDPDEDGLLDPAEDGLLASPEGCSFDSLESPEHGRHCASGVMTGSCGMDTSPSLVTTQSNGKTM